MHDVPFQHYSTNTGIIPVHFFLSLRIIWNACSHSTLCRFNLAELILMMMTSVVFGAQRVCVCKCLAVIAIIVSTIVSVVLHMATFSRQQTLYKSYVLFFKSKTESMLVRL